MLNGERSKRILEGHLFEKFEIITTWVVWAIIAFFLPCPHRPKPGFVPSHTV